MSPFQQIRDLAVLAELKVEQYHLDASYIGFGSADRRFGAICPPWLWMLKSNTTEYFDHMVDTGLVVNYAAAMNPLLIVIVLMFLQFPVKPS